MLVVMVVFGCALVPVVIRVREARRQRVAVEAIAKLGGRVFYNYQRLENGEFKENDLAAPEWLMSILGDDFFCRVVTVDLTLTEATNTDIEQLNGLRELQSCCDHRDGSIHEQTHASPKATVLIG